MKMQNIPSPAEDLRLIRRVLEDTTPAYGPLVPRFRWPGLVWLVLTLVSVAAGALARKAQA